MLPVPDSVAISAYMIASRSSDGASRFVILYLSKKKRREIEEYIKVRFGTHRFSRGKERLLQCGMESSGRDHCGYPNSFFVCVYCKRVKVFYPLVVTSLEGLRWWSPIIGECTEQP